MSSILRLYSPKTIVVTIVVVAGLIWYGTTNPFAAEVAPAAAIEPAAPGVRLITSREYQSDASLSLLGTVAAASEASVQSERGGRVVRVGTTLGSSVGAGSVLVAFENASERAAVTQAQGAYEAALASAEQARLRNESGVGNAELAIESAKNTIVQAVQNSYNTANSVLVSSVDQFYSNPLGIFPGVRISRTDVRYMRSERLAFQDIMGEWQNEAQLTSYTNQSENFLSNSIDRVERLTLLVDHIISATNRADSSDVLSGRPVSEYTAQLIAERDRLVAATQSLRAADNGLRQAEESLEQTRTQDTSSVTGLSDAQVKQALGALQAAQANLQKTIITSPIAGVVNELTISVGDFVSPGTVVAKIVNDSGLEITTYLSERDFSALSVGDSVLLNGDIKGTVTNLASTLSLATGKREVRIAASDSKLKPGDSVRITIPVSSDTDISSPTVITLPLSAVRFDGTNGYVYQVESDMLVRTEVTIGRVIGTNVEIAAGIALDSVVVQDARGKQAGQVVTVITD